MNTLNTRRARFSLPMLLLAGALALPAGVQADPPAHSNGRNRNHQKQEEKVQVKVKVKETNKEQFNRRQAELQRQAEMQRQAELRRNAQLQREAEIRRKAELQRQAEFQRRNAGRRLQPGERRVGFLNGTGGRYRYYDRRYDRYYDSRWGRGESIVVDGFLTNEGRTCQALRDDNGQLFMLVGNTYGLRTGDHTRVIGRVVDGGYCDWEGTAFEVTDVTALWGDARHRTTYYHHNYDGDRFGNRNTWIRRHPRAFENRPSR